MALHAPKHDVGLVNTNETDLSLSPHLLRFIFRLVPAPAMSALCRPPPPSLSLSLTPLVAAASRCGDNSPKLCLGRFDLRRRRQ